MLEKYKNLLIQLLLHKAGLIGILSITILLIGIIWGLFYRTSAKQVIQSIWSFGKNIVTNKMTLSSLLICIASFTAMNMTNGILSAFIENIAWASFVFTGKQIFWPLELKDYNKFIPIACVYFAIVFSLTLTRQIKDALIVPNTGGAGVVAAKLFVGIFNIPYMIFYRKMSKKVSVDKLVWVTIIPILLYFIIHPIFLSGNSALIFSASTIEALHSLLTFTIPFTSIKFTLSMFANLLAQWPDLLYYICAETLCVAGMAFFWHFASSFIAKDETKRFLPCLMIIAQFAGLISGQVAENICSKSMLSRFGMTKIMYLTTFFFFVAILTIILSQKYFFKYSVDLSMKNDIKKNNKVEAGSMGKFIGKYPHYFLLAGTIVLYGLTASLLEPFFKTLIQLQTKWQALDELKGIKYTAKMLNDIKQAKYLQFTGSFFQNQARLAMASTLVLSNLATKYLGWFVAASITPLVAGIGAFGIFGQNILSRFVTLFLDKSLNAMVLERTLVSISIIIGQYVLNMFKAFKYVFIDTRREMFIINVSSSEAEDIAIHEINKTYHIENAPAHIEAIRHKISYHKHYTQKEVQELENFVINNKLFTKEEINQKFKTFKNQFEYQQKTNAKVLEGMINRFGKSGGAGIQQILISLGITHHSNAFAIIGLSATLGFCGLWIISNLILSKVFSSKKSHRIH